MSGRDAKPRRSAKKSKSFEFTFLGAAATWREHVYSIPASSCCIGNPEFEQARYTQDGLHRPTAKSHRPKPRPVSQATMAPILTSKLPEIVYKNLLDK
jgi:hypothetical protein